MRILGIDYGRRRTGMAVSDALGITAQPLPTLHEHKPELLIEKIAQAVREKDITEVVIGLPRNMDGTLGKSGEEVMGFVDKLRASLVCPVMVEDERLTTIMADRALAALGESSKVRKKKLDTVAAQLILQTYLDRKRGCSEQDVE